MKSRRSKFRYRRRSDFHFLLRISDIRLGDIDSFVHLAKRAHGSERASLDRIAAKRSNAPDDWLVDEVAGLDDFAALSSEFAIFGLWRCVELYRKAAIRIALDEKAARQSYRHKRFQKQLLSLGIKEDRLRCARSVDELRCLNNAIKHNQQVDSFLASFPRWRAKLGDELPNLDTHYARLRSAAERYLRDLADRLSRRVSVQPSP